MAKRAKATKAAKKVKAAEPEPFFRPFAKIKKAEKAKEAKVEEKPRAAPPPRHAPRPTQKEDAPVEHDTFAIYMAGVRALPSDRAHRIPATASRVERASGAAKPIDDADDDARARMRSLVIEGLRFETIDDGERIEGRRIDIDPRELRRLRRAQYAIDGKLDLHGLGAQEARQSVEGFIKKRAVDGDRVVIIVHGKGAHSPRGHAVLRGEIAAWLSQGRSARHVAAFATAPADEGGSGAVLVLLAR